MSMRWNSSYNGIQICSMKMRKCDLIRGRKDTRLHIKAVCSNCADYRQVFLTTNRYLDIVEIIVMNQLPLIKEGRHARTA